MRKIQIVLSLSVLFFMLLDPLGNLPVFVSMLKRLSLRQYVKVVLRESVFALLAMLLAMGLGNTFLRIIHVSGETFTIAGGLILLLIGIKMVFSTLSHRRENGGERIDEPFIVPLAIPLICGPGLIAMLIAMPGNTRERLAALFLAWCVQTVILLFGKKIAILLGNKVVDALESLMGLLLTAIAIGMILDGINKMYHIGGAV